MTRAPVAAAPVVAIRSLSKSFGAPPEPTPVLRDVALEIGQGEKVSLVGPSGCGKSTLLLLIAGVLRPDSGIIEIDGAAMSELGDRERAELRAHRIGIALQADNLIPFLTARENVELARSFDRRAVASRSRRRRRGAAQEHAVELLERFDVAHRADHRPRQLSGGEAQRVALAVSMVNEPALLLADEVVAALDDKTAGHVVDEVLEADCAVLYVTHDISLADRVDRRLSLDGHTVIDR